MLLVLYLVRFLCNHVFSASICAVILLAMHVYPDMTVANKQDASEHSAHDLQDKILEVYV